MLILFTFSIKEPVFEQNWFRSVSDLSKFTQNLLLNLFLVISRTDTGVHALNSAVVVDLERKNGHPYDCDHITCMLNRSFYASPHKVRVNRTQLVPNTFNQHVNAVKSRTYMYRLGIIKPNMNISYKLEEKDRCFFMYTYVFIES